MTTDLHRAFGRVTAARLVRLATPRVLSASPQNICAPIRDRQRRSSVSRPTCLDGRALRASSPCAARSYTVRPPGCRAQCAAGVAARHPAALLTRVRGAQRARAYPSARCGGQGAPSLAIGSYAVRPIQAVQRREEWAAALAELFWMQNWVGQLYRMSLLMLVARRGPRAVVPPSRVGPWARRVSPPLEQYPS